MFDDDTLRLAETLGRILQARGERVTCAESCTGGLLAAAITAVPGSSAWFHGSLVTYDNAVKRSLLGVPDETLREDGAVSERTVREMAQGVLRQVPSHWSLSVSGIAGPEGGVPGKPVGTVWFGLGRALEGGMVDTQAQMQLLSGSRADVRLASVRFALAWLLQTLERDRLLA
ncbi:CinA family protein [Achromobacter sp. GG226]|uniref:CinA family protein n=1 Tax=Verticiella alkaliphila TaxID=2779529 RepID=UPI001C0DCABD|nr:CinA family protein [Verticiella sp. GG226]MBU4611023.1 CinA family protein [Verticiella sp. GG226]